VMWLVLNAENVMVVCLAVLMQYVSVRDEQTKWTELLWQLVQVVSMICV